MADLTTEQIANLDAASARVAAGTPGLATKSNAGDIANIKYATKNLGYSYNPVESPATIKETITDTTLKDIVGEITPDITSQIERPEITTSISEEDKANIATTEAKRRALIREQANATFDPIERRAKETGASQISTVKGVTGQRAGFNISTAEAALIDTQQRKIDTRLDEIAAQKAAFIASGDSAAADRAEQSIKDLKDEAFKLSQAQAAQYFNLRADERATVAALGVEEKRERGNKILFDFASELPGFYTELTDEEKSIIEFTGLVPNSANNKLATYIQNNPDEDLTVETKTFTDNSGNVVVIGIDKVTGDELWRREEGGLGKSLQAPTSVTFPTAQRSFWYKDGVQVGYQLFYPISGDTKNFTIDGQEMDVPTDARLATSSFNTGDAPLKFGD